MRNKKLVSLSVASVLAAGAIASTLAWFTSTDKITNSFEISVDNNTNDGIKVIDTLERNIKVFPGETIGKKIYAENKANYDQIVRVEIEKVWKATIDNEEKIVSYYNMEDNGIVYLTEEEKKDDDGAEPLKYSFIKLNSNSSNFTNVQSTTRKVWIDVNGKNSTENNILTYYYNDILEINKGNNLDNEYKESRGSDSTKDLLDSVTLLGEAGEVYENLKFEVIVTAESIQAANNAATLSWGEDIPQAIKTLVKNYANS